MKDTTPNPGGCRGVLRGLVLLIVVAATLVYRKLRGQALA